MTSRRLSKLTDLGIGLDHKFLRYSSLAFQSHIARPLHVGWSLTLSILALKCSAVLFWGSLWRFRFTEADISFLNTRSDHILSPTFLLLLLRLLRLLLLLLLSRYNDWLRAGRSGIETGWGRDFLPLQTGPGAHPVSCKMGIETFQGVKCGRGVLLTTNPLLVPPSWKSRAILLPTLWATPGL